MAATTLTLKVLMLENNPADAIHIQQVLKDENSRIEFFCATNKREYTWALNKFFPDIILFENCLPNFTATEALEIYNEHNPPFILVTGILSEEQAIRIVKKGADDYILKNGLARLPLAIEAAIKKHELKNELRNYNYLLNQAVIVSVMDTNGLIIDVNESFCELSGYEATELIGRPHPVYKRYHPTSYFKKIWTTISNGKIWKGELHAKGKTNDDFWVDTTIVPFLDHRKEVYQYVTVSKNVTERKKLQARIAAQHHDQKLKLAATILSVQEKERNYVGQELHDNINQILVGIKILLSSIIKGTGDSEEFIKLCHDKVGTAIEENRKIARVLITPAFEEDSLLEQLNALFDSMLTVAGINVHMDPLFFNETLLDKNQKLAIYRVAQEQCTNIIKYAHASNVFVQITTAEKTFSMSMSDDGAGIKESQKIKGIGLRNIAFRMATFKGSSRIISSPHEGFTLEIEMPLKREAVHH
jgi:two-component system, NarL family, sensor histidine kinase UhpB